jgi:hypothetical protein
VRCKNKLESCHKVFLLLNICEIIFHVVEARSIPKACRLQLGFVNTRQLETLINPGLKIRPILLEPEDRGGSRNEPGFKFTTTPDSTT